MNETGIHFTEADAAVFAVLLLVWMSILVIRKIRKGHVETALTFMKVMLTEDIGSSAKADMYVTLMFIKGAPFIKDIYKKLKKQQISLSPKEKQQLTEGFINICCSAYDVPKEKLFRAIKDNNEPQSRTAMKVEYLAYAFNTTLQAMEGTLPWEDVINNWLLVRNVFEVIDK